MDENTVPARPLQKLAAALAKAQSEYKTLNKSKVAVINSTKGSYQYKYADLPDLIEATRAALGKNGLSFVQLLSGDRLITKLMHESGEDIESWVHIAQNQSPQAFGSTLTYYKRYLLGSMLGIASEEDDDASGGQAEDEDERSQGQQRPTAAAPKPAQSENNFISAEQSTRMWAIAKECGWNSVDVHSAIKQALGLDSVKQIQKRDYDSFIKYMQKYPKPYGEQP